MEPDDLNKLIVRLQADLPTDVLEDMLQAVIGGQALAQTRSVDCSDFMAWLLVSAHDAKSYVLIEDSNDDLHAIDASSPDTRDFWVRLLDMRTDDCDCRDAADDEDDIEAYDDETPEEE